VILGRRSSLDTNVARRGDQLTKPGQGVPVRRDAANHLFSVLLGREASTIAPWRSPHPELRLAPFGGRTKACGTSGDGWYVSHPTRGFHVDVVDTIPVRRRLTMAQVEVWFTNLSTSLVHAL
jgi:hypothetical protein